MDAFTGEIRIFGFAYPPVDWAYCDGSIIQAGQNPALYSILQNYYGGTAPSTFALPVMKGFAPMGTGNGPGLTSHPIGTATGVETVTLSSSQVGYHSHTVTGKTVPANQVSATTMSAGPTATSFLSHLYHLAPLPKGPVSSFSSSPPDTTLAPQTVSVFPGTAQAHSNQQPYLVMNFCICTSGIYPIKP